MDASQSVAGGLRGAVTPLSPGFALSTPLKNPIAVKNPAGTPMSQASTMPNTPCFSRQMSAGLSTSANSSPTLAWQLPDALDGLDFPRRERQLSMDSITDEMYFEDAQHPFKAFPCVAMMPVIADDEEVDEDGMRWVKVNGTGLVSESVAPEEVKNARGKFRVVSSTHHRMLERQYLPEGEVPPPKMSDLEAQMSEVKALFKQKFGEDLDSEDEEEEDVDEDGMRWVKTVGTGIPSTSVAPEETVALGGKFRTLSRAHHRMLERQYLPEGEVPPPKMSDLEAQMAEVKALFKQKYGEDLDSEEEDEVVGAVFPLSGGKFRTLSRTHHRMLERQYLQKPAPDMSTLEAKLAEVKALYKQKYGEDVDEGN